MSASSLAKPMGMGAGKKGVSFGSGALGAGATASAGDFLAALGTP